MTAIQTLRVGQLRQLLEGLPDETYVVVAKDGWYQNLRVEVPTFPLTDDADYQEVTLFATGDYDVNQFVWDQNPVGGA